jgi:hypothetical protein
MHEIFKCPDIPDTPAPAFRSAPVLNSIIITQHILFFGVSRSWLSLFQHINGTEPEGMSCGPLPDIQQFNKSFLHRLIAEALPWTHGKEIVPAQEIPLKRVDISIHNLPASQRRISSVAFSLFLKDSIPSIWPCTARTHIYSKLIRKFGNGDRVDDLDLLPVTDVWARRRVKGLVLRSRSSICTPLSPLTTAESEEAKIRFV